MRRGCAFGQTGFAHAITKFARNHASRGEVRIVHDRDDPVDAVRRARADFLAADHSRPLSWRVASGTPVRPTIVTSWERSRRADVRPDVLNAPYRDLAEPPDPLLPAARESVDWLAENLDDPEACLLLTTPDARILERRSGGRAFLRRLDAIHAAPGHVFAEDMVGTNAIGTALVDNDFTDVYGAEHYHEALQDLTGAGAPITDPTTGGTVGAIAIICSDTGKNRFLRTLVLGAVRDISRALLNRTPDSEQVLLNIFLAETNRSSEPLIAVGQSMFIGNQAGLQLLQRSSRQHLWEQVAGQLDPRHPTTILLETSTGSTITAHATAIMRRGQAVGALLRLSITTRSLRSVRTIPAMPQPARRFIPGDSPVAHRLRHAVHLAARTGKPALVIGEAGAGRGHIARVLLHSLNDSSPIVTLNLSNDTADGVRTSVAMLRSGTNQRLVLRDIDRAAENLAPLDVLLGDAIARGANIVATAADASSIKQLNIASRFSTLIQVPPLRARLVDLEAIATDLLIKLAGSPHAAPSMSTQTVQALATHDWPGNIRELQSILAAALSASGNEPVIRLEHLPGRYRAPNRERRMSTIERAERKAIEEALEHADGNKLAAASSLGIARSTLYRKMRALGITTD